MTFRSFLCLAVILMLASVGAARSTENSKASTKQVKASKPKIINTVRPDQDDKSPAGVKATDPIKKAEAAAATTTAEPAAPAAVVVDGDHLAFMQQEETSSSSPEPSSGSLLIKTIGAMLLVVGLIFFAAWGVKKLGFGGPKTGSVPEDLELTVLSTVSMGGGRTISTLKFGERVLLVGSTAESFTLLAEDAGNSKFSIGNSRSVAEMLADDDGSFGAELEHAEMRLGGWDARGELA